MECFSDKIAQHLAVASGVKFANKVDDDFAAEKPITVSQLFQKAVAMFPDLPALRYRIDGTPGDWEELTYSQYYNKCLKVAKAYIKVSIANLYPATATA